MSNFYEGQKVVCINDKFPVISTTELDKNIVGTQPSLHPKVGETLSINEMLGDEWLRFDKYDFESFNWWHYSRFRPIDEFEVTMSDQLKNECVALAGEIA